MHSRFDMLMFSGSTLLTGLPVIPMWNEQGTDVLPADVLPPPPEQVPDPTGDFLGLSVAARMTPRMYKRTNPMMDPLEVPELLSPDGALHLSTVDGNLVARSTADGRSFALTTDGSPEHEWRFDWSNPIMAVLGLTAAVTNFSQDGRLLAAYKVDNSRVPRATQVHYLKRDDEIIRRYAAKAGSELERTTLHILDLYGKSTVQLDLGDTTDTYPVFGGWLPDGEVLVFIMTRNCRRVDVLAANVTSGLARHLFSEVGESFVRIQHDVYYGRKLGLHVTPDGSGILWESERSGWKHLYLYDLQGALVRQLTSGDFPVDGVVGHAEGMVYLTARTDQARPYDVHICRVPLDGGELEVLTADTPGVHSALLSPTGKALLDTTSSVSTAPTVTVREPDGTVVREVLRVDTTALDALDLPAAEKFCVKAADGVTDLWGVLFKPRDFGPDKIYPVIEYVYGGPQIQIVSHQFPFATPFGPMLAALTELGACVVMLDGRGTPGRSKSFHDVVYKNMGGALADDHAGAIKQLAQTRPYLDLAHVGVTGGSWGGYTSTRLLADRPDVYSAAVSNLPSYDPYNSLLYECYLGLPQEPGGREVYDAANVLGLASSITRPLMIAAGTSDHHTWADVLKMSEQLVQADVEHELVVLPGQHHGYDLVHNRYFHRKMASFFATHLGTTPPEELSS